MRKLLQGKGVFYLFFWLTYLAFALVDTQHIILKKGWLYDLVPISIYLGMIAGLLLFNHRVLIKLLLEKGKKVLYAFGILVSIVIYTYCRSLLQQYYDGIVWPDDKMQLSGYFKFNILNAVYFILIATLLYFTKQWTEHKQREKNIKIAELQNELKYLRAQLSPHFLFNSLNTIYGSIDMANEEARNTLLQFSDLLRYHLQDADVDWVSLRSEADYLTNYVSLQRARSNPNRTIRLNVDITNPDLLIPPLLFLALIENAFKFSNRDDMAPGFVDIELVQKDRGIVFTCRNSYDPEIASGSGIGLSNVKRRLELIYPDKYDLQIQKDTDIYLVVLKLTL